MSEKKESILIIEDDEALSSSLAELLRSKGYAVDTALNGTEALSRSKKSFHHLAIIDIKLPDKEGTDLLDKLRQTVPPMRKIILTGYPDLGNAVKSVNLGVDKYLIKPVQPRDLLKTVEEELKKRREEAKYSQKKVGEYIKTKVAEAEKRRE